MIGTEGVWTISLGLLGVFIATVLYMLGGTEGFAKWLRRFVGSFILALDANILAIVNSLWDWRYLLIFPCLAAGFSLGYGSESTLAKIFKRTIFALGVLSVCVVGAWITNFTFYSWTILALAGITGLTSVVLGVINPFNNAPLEQALICLVLCMYVPWWSFVR